MKSAILATALLLGGFAQAGITTNSNSTPVNVEIQNHGHWQYLGCSNSPASCKDKAESYGYHSTRTNLSTSCSGGKSPVTFDCFGR